MTIGDLATLICQDVGDTDPASIAFCTTHIQRKYAILYHGHNWQQAIDTAIIVPPYLGPGNPISHVYLPYFIDKVLNVKFSIDTGLTYRRLTMRERDWIDKFDSTSFYPSATGQQPSYWYVAQPISFPAIPPLSAPITITPVLPTAQAISVFLEGVDANGGYLSEMFSVSGSTPTTGQLIYKRIVNITVGSNADVILTFSSSGVSVNSQIGGGTIRLVDLVLWPGYDGVQQIQVLYKMKIDKIPSAMSTTRITPLDDPLYYFARGAMYGRQRQKDLEAADYGLAQTLFEAAKKIELEQAGMMQQIVPVIFDDPGALFDGDGGW